MIVGSQKCGTMHDPSVEAQLKDHANRLRALENERFPINGASVGDDGFGGVREYSRAWEANRSTAYLLRKSWADPLARAFAIVVLCAIAAIWTYLLIS